MFAIAYPTSSFAMNQSSPSEPETTKSSWKGSFDAFWKTHRNSVLIGSGVAAAAALAAVLHARNIIVVEPTNPAPTCPASRFPDPRDIFVLCEPQSCAALPDQSSIPPSSFQTGIDQSENAVSSLADRTETQFTNLNGTPSLDPVVFSQDAISHNSHQAAEVDSLIPAGYPVSDVLKENNSAPSLFCQDPRFTPGSVFSENIPISLIPEPSTSANCSSGSLTQYEDCPDPVNPDNSAPPPLSLIPTVEKSNILTQAWESVATLAYDRFNQFDSYLKNSLSKSRDELSFNLFSMRVVYDIGLLGGVLYYTHSRGLYISPGDQSLLVLGAVKTFRDIFMPPPTPSSVSSVIKILGIAFAFSGLIN